MDHSPLPLVSLRNVTFDYGNGTVLENIGLDIPAGTIHLVKGPSGGGKSTLLRLIAQFERLQTGTISYQGNGLSDIPIRTYRLQVGYLHQKPVIAPGTVRDNLNLAFRFRREERAVPGEHELRSALDRLDLQDVSLDQRADELSVGQQQRAAFLRLILMKTPVLLLDEPLASLDDRSAACVIDLLLELNNSAGTTILISAHGTHTSAFGGRILHVEHKSAWIEQ